MINELKIYPVQITNDKFIFLYEFRDMLLMKKSSGLRSIAATKLNLEMKRWLYYRLKDIDVSQGGDVKFQTAYVLIDSELIDTLNTTRQGSLFVRQFQEAMNNSREPVSALDVEFVNNQDFPLVVTADNAESPNLLDSSLLELAPDEPFNTPTPAERPNMMLILSGINQMNLKKVKNVPKSTCFQSELSNALKRRFAACSQDQEEQESIDELWT